MKLEPKSKTKPALMWQAKSHDMYTDTGKKQQGYVNATRPLKTVSTRGNMSRQQIFLCVNFSLGLCYVSVTWEAWWSNGMWKECLRNDPRAGHCVVFLGKKIYPHCDPSPSRCILKWVTLKYAGGDPAMDQHPIEGGVDILLDVSCYGSRDKLRSDGPLGSKAEKNLTIVNFNFDLET